MGMSSEYSELIRNERAKKRKRYSILSTSGVYSVKQRINLLVASMNLIVIAGLTTAGVYYYGKYSAYREQEMLSSVYLQAVNANYEPPIEEIVPDASEDNTDIGAEEVEKEKPMVLLDGAKVLLAENEDTAGYIKIDGIKVDNVVVQGDDNEFYLNHDFYGKKSQPGTLFIDNRCTVNTRRDSDNLIIYGHNQKDGRMFGELDLYKWNPEFWKEHYIINFNTNYEENEYVIVASFVTNELASQDNGNLFDYYNYIYFNKYYPFETWYTEIMQRTTFWTGIECTAEDEYITLSTCSTEWEPSRHVIIARKLHEGEVVDTSKWEENTNPKWPQIYYDLYFGGKVWKEGI